MTAQLWLRAILSTAVLLALSACQTQSNRFAGEPELLLPAGLGAAVQVSQHLVVEVAGERRNLLVVWKVDARQLHLVGLTAQGRRMFSVSYDGEQLDTQRFVPLPADFSDRRFIRELQWAYWPEDQVAASLAAVGWRLRVESGRRLIYSPAGHEWEYRYLDEQFPAGLTLTHSQRYQMKIDTLSVAPLQKTESSAEN